MEASLQINFPHNSVWSHVPFCKEILVWVIVLEMSKLQDDFEKQNPLQVSLSLKGFGSTKMKNLDHGPSVLTFKCLTEMCKGVDAYSSCLRLSETLSLVTSHLGWLHGVGPVVLIQ